MSDEEIKYGKLTPLKLIRRDSRGESWLCQCECGKEKAVTLYNLKCGHVKSCGCSRKESTAIIKTQHGHARSGMVSKEYLAWRNMRNRCNNPKDKYFIHYGGRGIAVCKEWEVFARFLSDMGPAPSKNHSIDRIDNNGNYCKENCRWATTGEQGSNRSDTIRIEIFGLIKPLCVWADEFGLLRTTVWRRFRGGWPKERLFQPTLRNPSSEILKTVAPK